MDEFDFLNRRTAENRRANEVRATWRMVIELVWLIVGSAVLAFLVCVGLMPDLLAVAIVLAATAFVFYRLGRFIGQ